MLIKYSYILLFVMALIFVIYYVFKDQELKVDGENAIYMTNSSKKNKEIIHLEGNITPYIIRDFYSLHGFYPKKIPPFLMFQGRYVIDEKANKMVDNKSGSMVGIRYATINAYLLEGYDAVRKCSCYSGIVGEKYVANKFFAYPNDHAGTMPNIVSPIEIKQFDFKDDENELILKAKKNKSMDIDQLILEFRKEKIDIFKDNVMRGIESNEDYIGFVIDIWRYADENTIDPFDAFLEQKQLSLVKLRLLWAYIILKCKNKLPLIERQIKEETSDIVKVKMIEAISKLGGDINPEQNNYVNGILEKGRWHEKIIAIEALASFEAASFGSIVKCLQDKEPDVRTAAMLALTKIAPGKAIKPLFETYKSEKEIDMKYNAWYCLTQCLDPQRKVISLKEFHDKEKEITASLEKIMSEKKKAEKEKESKEKKDAE